MNKAKKFVDRPSFASQIPSLFFLVAIPALSLFQTEVFLWFTGRPAATSLSIGLLNGFYMILASLPSMSFGLLEFKNKIAAFEKKERLNIALSAE